MDRVSLSSNTVNWSDLITLSLFSEKRVHMSAYSERTLTNDFERRNHNNPLTSHV